MFTLLAVCFVITWNLPGRYPHDLAAVVNKKEMLIEKKSPRLVFMGGSSLLTLNSPRIEKETKYSVANMGLWGGLSTERYLAELKEALNPGDVIVITQEYGTVLDPPYAEFIQNNDESKKFLFLLSPGTHIAQYIQEGRPFDAFKIMMQLIQMKTKSYIENILTCQFSKVFTNGYEYYEDEFDSNGDRLTPFKILRPLDSTNKKFSPHNMKNHVYLNQLQGFAHKKNIKVFYYFSHIPNEEFKLNESLITGLANDIKKSAQYTIINSPTDFIFPREYFADTIYHLNEKGEAARTEKLIQFLKKAL